MTDLFDETRRAAFLSSHGYTLGEAAGQDVSSRRYFRIHSKTDNSVKILMESMPDSAAGASEGHKMADFVRIADYLIQNGLRAPVVDTVDHDGGYMILEDFGTMSFKRAGEESLWPREALYALAADVLVKMRALTDLPDLPEYYDSRIHAGHRDIITYAVPYYTAHQASEDLHGEYWGLWEKIENSLPPCPSGFMHIDYHGENLMVLKDTESTDQCGIIDFQEAMIGPCAYDLVNLLEDARIDVPMDIRTAMIEQYCTGMTADERETFMAWYRILGTQFHCRVLGLFVRLGYLEGNAKYAAFIPILQKHLREGLSDPLLAPIKRFFTKLGLDF
jgi:aminoglycoside/choline kinase family phosphotransferase